MCSGLNPKNLFNRSPTPPSSGSASSGGTSPSIAGVSSFPQQSYHIEAHRRAVWNAFWRRVFSARNVFLADIARLDSQSAGIFFMDSSIRLKDKAEGSTRLTYTGLRGGLEHLKNSKDRDEVNIREVCAGGV